ncbi:MAG TPA: hypothetical protein PLE85_05590 [Bacteroidales bacterium]|nr:hypothetical protein [Lentimicrobiaceae bacterium]HOH99996.1 hypothetical protein [Bacteroidales bacterium]
MKKVLVVLSLFAFLAASSISVNTAVASELSVEMVKLDKDPKAGEKKSKKDAAKAPAAAETKSGDCGSAPAAAPKSSCCKGETKAACSGPKTTSAACPDKK